MTRQVGIPRRRVLVGLVGAFVVAVLAACGRSPVSTSSPSPVATPAPRPTPPMPTPSPSPTASPTSSPSPTTDVATLRRKAARLLIVGFRGTSIRPGDAITDALDAGLGGVILFDRDQTTGGERNVTSPAQLTRLTAQLRKAATVPLLIAIDQEGGRVARLDPDHGFPATRSEADIGASDDPDEALAAGRAMGATLEAAGIDLDLAPVVDLDLRPDNPAIGALGRSFSADPAVVTAMAEAEIRGLRQHGVRTALKHFPGLGSATANTDFARADVTDTWRDEELDPYRGLLADGSVDAVMVGHIRQRHLDPTLPASLSPAIVGGLLRRDLGWDGAVITDDLGAVAIAADYDSAEAVALALEAGVDLLLFANQARYVDDLAERLVTMIVRHVTSGRILEARLDESIARIDRIAIS